MVGHGGSSAGSYLANPTSPIPSHCASIVVTSTLRVNILHPFYEKVGCFPLCKQSVSLKNRIIDWFLSVTSCICCYYSHIFCYFLSTVILAILIYFDQFKHYVYTKALGRIHTSATSTFYISDHDITYMDCFD